MRNYKGESYFSDPLECFEMVKKCAEKEGLADAASLDSQKAFDEVPHQMILRKSNSFGRNGTIPTRTEN